MNRTDRVRLTAAFFALGIALGSLAVGRAAAESDAEMPVAADAPLSDESRDKAGWEPRLSLGFGVLTQPHKGEANVPTETSRTTISNSGDSFVSGHFKFGMDLLTPLELRVPTRPRLVVLSSFQVPIARGLIANRENIRFNGAPTPTPGFAENCPATVGTSPPLNTSTCSVGVRSRTSVDYLWTAGIGVDFTLPLDQEQFHFTQGFEYIGMAAQAAGRYTRTSTGNLVRPPLPPLQDLETEFIDALGDLELHHGISITETFSVDAHAQGPFVFGFYMQGRMSWFVTDRDMSVSESSPRGRFDFTTTLNDPEPIQYQLVGGLSVRFDPRRR